MGIDANRYYADARSLGSRFRSRRFRKFLLPVLEAVAAPGKTVRILDLGGTPAYWIPYLETLDRLDCVITTLNLVAGQSGFARVRCCAGTATAVNEPDDAFDLVHSNSTIEHVGRWPDMERMATEIRRLAPAYYVQTPYFWFPVEPHFRAPFFHWLPEQWRARLLMHLNLGFAGSKSPTLGAAMERVQSAQLLDGLQMRALFPDAGMRSERVFGLAKSLIAIRLKHRWQRSALPRRISASDPLS